MMSTRLDVESNSASIDSDVGVKATSAPWIKLTVGVDSVSLSHKVLSDIESSEVAEGPVVVWSKTVKILAPSSISIVVEGGLDEHGVRAVTNWHSKLVASEDVPAIAIKVTSAFPVTKVSAWIVSSVVEVDVG